MFHVHFPKTGSFIKIGLKLKYRSKLSTEQESFPFSTNPQYHMSNETTYAGLGDILINLKSPKSAATCKRAF